MSQKNHSDRIEQKGGFFISRCSASASKLRETANNQSQPQKPSQPSNSQSPKK